MTVTVPGGSPPSRPYPTPYADVVEQAPVPVRRSRWSRLWLGPAEDPRWARPALVVLLLATGLLYVWNLGASGWANSFYSAAVQAGSTSWKAFFFGSFDSSSFITVDKPPASLWVMDLSARVFGLNAWSVLVPQALEGVAAVGLLYATVRRVASPAAGLLAGVVLACTPVATLMFRFNNPDALLVLLLVGAAYATTRALERGRTWWLLLAAGLVGTGFITKMLQAFILVPVLAVVYLVAAPGPVRRRLLQLVAAGAALVVASGWWVAVVSLVPMADRPYIGGSQTNSVLDLALGYNGLGRLNGNESGSVVGGGGPGGAGSWGATGWLRLFGADIGGQVAWLLPAALVLMVALLWLWRRVPRTDARRAAVLLWGGWLLLTGAVFSYAQGIIHPYYTVALAPAIGALVGIGGVTLWRLREVAWARFVLAGTVAITTFWTYALLERSPDWYPGLRTLVVVAGVLATAGLVAGPLLRGRATAAVAGTALAASLVAPVAYSLQTVSTPHTGALPTAGPAVAATRGGGPGGPAGFGPRRGFQGQGQSQGQRQGGFGPRGQGFGGQGFGGQGFGGQGFGGAGGGGALGGLLDAGTPSQALVALLRDDASSYDWVAAAVGANSAAGVQLATREPVMAIGGFNGTDPTPTLAQFQQLVAAGRVHYFLAGGRGGGGFGGGGSGPAGEITRWVEQTFTPQTVGGTTVYDLTATAANNGGTVRTT